MPDQIPADKVREIIAAHSDGARRRAGVILAALEDLLPPPPRPTLADMTEEERAACQWMQADVADHDTRYVITNPHDRHGEVTLIAPDGQIEWILPEYVTPRPDLPRMEWPDTVPESTLAVGSVWDDADALTRACAGFWRDQIVVADKRGKVGVWDTGMQCWRVSAPHADFAPYTVIHAGKKADQ